jgi:hypothetical protein
MGRLEPLIDLSVSSEVMRRVLIVPWGRLGGTKQDIWLSLEFLGGREERREVLWLDHGDPCRIDQDQLSDGEAPALA